MNKNDADEVILFAPLFHTDTYLIDKSGNVINTWKGKYPPSSSVYLRGNGNLVRTCSPGILANKSIRTTGAGLYVQELSWDGKLLWSFRYSNDRYRLHHDIALLPNGNILMLVYEKKNKRDAIAAGRDPALLKQGFLLSESVIEVKPVGPKEGKIVWKWHVWDHLIQDFDPSQKNFGNVAAHPELLDINFISKNKPDWIHLNSIDYNEETDQILLGSRLLSEIWIIDHSTTTKEAAGHAGGKSNKGGDILYRWGNPRAYRRGDDKDQRLFYQHDAQWIKNGFPGAGNILVFNNGAGRPRKEYSSIEEITPSINKKGRFPIKNKKPFGPEKPTWSFSGNKTKSFYSEHISGVQRLRSGDTLICIGGIGYFFQIAKNGRKKWSYQNRFSDETIYKKKMAEAKNYTTAAPNKPSRKKEAVFKIRQYSLNKDSGSFI